jgi:hypothetical protein
MDARILLADGTIIEIPDANTVLQGNRRKLVAGEAVKIPYQVAILCDPGNMNGRDFDYEDILKIELLFPLSEHAHLLRGKK